MSRIGKKPIPLPQGVKFEVKGNTVVVQGPKGQVQTHLPAGVQLKQADGQIQVTRQSDQHAAVHGLARALVNNAVEGVTKGWNRDLEIVGIGYRAELEGQEHRSIHPGLFAPDRVSAAHRGHGGDRSQADQADGQRH